MLKKDGVVVCFMCSVSSYTFTRKDRSGRFVKRHVTNYDWLFEEDELEILDIRYGKGTTIDFLDSAYPFAEYLKTKPRWEAYVDKASCVGWRILASAYGTNVVALARKVGHVSYLQECLCK